MNNYRLLKPENCYLHVIDPQKSLMKEVYEAARVARVIRLMIECGRLLGMPCLANTQYKKGLGLYDDELEKLVEGMARPDKVEFSAYENTETCGVVESLGSGRSTVVMVGVETHICVYQSAVGALQRGLTPWIVADGVSSRSPDNHRYGLARLERLGAIVGPAEMLIYELLGKAGTREFKEILPLIIAFNKDIG